MTQPKPRNPTMDEVLDLAKLLRLEVNDCDALLWLVVTAIAAWGDASAALPGPGAVEGEGPILRWTKNMPPSEGCRYDHCIAETPFGRFLISWKGWKQFDSPTVDETPWGDWYDAFNSVDEAKAACQREMDERLARWSHPTAPPAPEVGEAWAVNLLRELSEAFTNSFHGADDGLSPRLIRAANEAQRFLVTQGRPAALPEPSPKTTYDLSRQQATTQPPMGWLDQQSPQPAPAVVPEVGEVVEVREWLENHAAHLRKMQEIGAWPETKLQEMLDRAATLLQQPPAPAPAPAPPAPEVGDVGGLGELIAWLHDHALNCRELGRNDWAAQVASAAAVLRAVAEQVVPEVGEGLSLADIGELCEEHSFNCDDGESIEILHNMITAALVRWGRLAPAVVPVAVSERPPDPRPESEGAAITPSDRLALAVCVAVLPGSKPCKAPCNACRVNSAAVAHEIARQLRVHYGSSAAADWLDGVGCHTPGGGSTVQEGN